MTAYVIANIEVTDPERYEDYKRASGAALEPYGGRFIVRGGEAETLEGEWKPRRLVVIEFDSVERARAWWASEEYREPKALRQATATTDMVLVAGT